jgi:hypothetical protein
MAESATCPMCRCVIDPPYDLGVYTLPHHQPRLLLSINHICLSWIICGWLYIVGVEMDLWGSFLDNFQVSPARMKECHDKWYPYQVNDIHLNTAYRKVVFRVVNGQSFEFDWHKVSYLDWEKIIKHEKIMISTFMPRGFKLVYNPCSRWKFYIPWLEVVVWFSLLGLFWLISLSRWYIPFVSLLLGCSLYGWFLHVPWNIYNFFIMFWMCLLTGSNFKIQHVVCISISPVFHLSLHIWPHWRPPTWWE